MLIASDSGYVALFYSLNIANFGNRMILRQNVHRSFSPSCYTQQLSCLAFVSSVACGFWAVPVSCAVLPDVKIFGTSRHTGKLVVEGESNVLC